MLKSPEEYGYVTENNLCLFTKGPLSQWWGGFKDQDGGFEVPICALFPYIQGKWNTTSIQRELEGMYNPLLGADTPIKFNCCEQWMMACKALLMDDVESFKFIMNEPHPAEQKARGRQILNWDEDLYKKYRLLIVKNGNYEKFTYNKELQEWMIQNFHPHTVFVEASPQDKVWGIGLTASDPDAKHISRWKGLNLLGEALQYTRKKIQPDWVR